MEPNIPPRPIPPERLPVWDALPFLTFVMLNVVLCVMYYDDLASLFSLMTPFGFVLAGLATYRVAQIIANERVARLFRAPFVDIQVSHGHEEEVPKRRGFRETMGSLIYCPSCVGVWAAAGITYTLAFVPSAAWVAICIFALSAVERIVTGVTALIAQSASSSPEA